MSNRFALLAEDGGSGDEGITSVPDKTEKPAASGVSAKKVAPAPNATKGNQQAQAGGRKDFFPGRTGQGRKVLSEDGPREAKENTKRAGGETRGSARGRGGRGRGRNPRPDRHSQMDRETTGKADHQAWGGDDGQRELDDETNAQNDADREANASGVATPADPNAPSTPAPAEEEDKTQSYAEYLAAQVAATGESLAEKLGLKKEARQANEGADEAQWKNAKIFSKDDDDSFFAGESKDKKNKNKQKEGKTFLEIDAPAYRPQNAGRGGSRGGRGGSRGGAPRGGASRGRGAPRGGNSGARSQRAGGPDLSEAAFPSLS